MSKCIHFNVGFVHYVFILNIKYEFKKDTQFCKQCLRGHHLFIILINYYVGKVEWNDV